MVTARTTQLRRYCIKSGSWDDFLIVWRQIVDVRRKHGFSVLFAFSDRENNQFTWALAVDGDLDEAASLYYRDPERVALERVREYVTHWEVSVVQQELPAILSDNRELGTEA